MAKVLGAAVLDSSSVRSIVISDELLSKCEGLLFDEALKVNFWMLRMKKTLSKYDLARVEESVACAEAITQSFIDKIQLFNDDASCKQFAEEFYQTMRNADIEGYFYPCEKFGNSALTNLARLKLDPFALRFSACWSFWAAVHYGEYFEHGCDASHKKIIAECVYSQQSLRTTSGYFSQIHGLLKPEPDLQGQAALVEQVVATFGQLYARYRENLDLYLEKYGVLFQEASNTAYGKNQAKMLLKGADWDLGLMDGVQVGHKSASYSIPKPGEGLFSLFSLDNQKIINQHIALFAQHAFDIFWPKVNQFVCEHAALGIDCPSYLEAYPPALETIQGHLTKSKSEMTNLNGETQKDIFDPIFAMLGSAPAQIDLSQPSLYKAIQHLHIFTEVTNTLNMASVLLDYALCKHRPQCFSTKFTQTIADLHKACSQFAITINEFVHSFRERAQDPELRLSLGCHLYGILLPVSMKLAAFDKTLGAYNAARTIASSGDQSAATPYDRDAAEVLFKDPPAIRISMLPLFKDQNEDGPA